MCRLFADDLHVGGDPRNVLGCLTVSGLAGFGDTASPNSAGRSKPEQNLAEEQRLFFLKISEFSFLRTTSKNENMTTQRLEHKCSQLHYSKYPKKLKQVRYSLVGK